MRMRSGDPRQERSYAFSSNPFGNKICIFRIIFFKANNLKIIYLTIENYIRTKILL